MAFVVNPVSEDGTPPALNILICPSQFVIEECRGVACSILGAWLCVSKVRSLDRGSGIRFRPEAFATGR